MIGKLSELLVSGHHAGFLDVGTSPRSPLDLKIQSPRGMKTYDLGGVGLGIVAALEKSGDRDFPVGCTICSSNLNRSNPIPVMNSINNYNKNKEEFLDEESLENYTYVTCRLPNNKPFTKVYYDSGDNNNNNIYGRSIINHRKNDLGRCDNQMSIFDSPSVRSGEEFSSFPTSDFLSSCHLCRKKLHGKDIYMYRYNTI